MNLVNHDFFMKKALNQAKIALKNNEVPVGAVIIDPNNEVIAQSYNKIEKLQKQQAHAEVLAIEKACKKIGNWRLNGCKIYVTIEPCLMCFGLIQLSRLEKIIFGAKSTLFGVGLYKVESSFPCVRKIDILGGIQKQECLGILKLFFSEVRNKRKESCEAKKNVSRRNKKETS